VSGLCVLILYSREFLRSSTSRGVFEAAVSTMRWWHKLQWGGTRKSIRVILEVYVETHPFSKSRRGWVGILQK